MQMTCVIVGSQLSESAAFKRSLLCYELPQAGANHIHPASLLLLPTLSTQVQSLAHRGYLTHLFNVE